MIQNLITGGVGFIGFHLARALLVFGEDVTILDNFDDFYPPSIKEDNAKELCLLGAKLIRLDIREVKNLSCGTCFHLAAMAGVQSSMRNVSKYWDVNVNGTQNLLKNLDCGKLVFASTSSVYGENPPFEETAELKPLSPYAKTKVIAEQLCLQRGGMSARLFSVYGQRQRPDLALPSFAKRLYAGQALTIRPACRAFTHVSDVATGLIALRDKGRQGEVYNIAQEKSHTIDSLVDYLESASGLFATRNYEKLAECEMRITHASTKKAQAELGFRAQTELPEGVRQYVRWYEKTSNGVVNIPK